MVNFYSTTNIFGFQTSRHFHILLFCYKHRFHTPPSTACQTSDNLKNIFHWFFVHPLEYLRSWSLCQMHWSMQWWWNVSWEKPDFHHNDCNCHYCHKHHHHHHNCSHNCYHYADDDQVCVNCRCGKAEHAVVEDSDHGDHFVGKIFDRYYHHYITRLLASSSRLGYLDCMIVGNVYNYWTYHLTMANN